MGTGVPLISRDPLRPRGSCGHVGAGAVRSEVLTAQERGTHILTGKFPRTNISRALKIFLKAPCEPKANASVGHDPKVTLTESSCDPRKRCEKSPAPILHIPQMLLGFPFPGLPLSKQVWWEDRHCAEAPAPHYLSGGARESGGARALLCVWK